MTAPGIQTITRIAVPAQAVPTDASTGFCVATAAQGPLAPQLITSLDQAITLYGARQPTGYLYDWLDLNFKEGLGQAWVARAAPAAAVSAVATLNDTAATPVIALTANGPGTFGNSYTADVVAGVASSTKTLILKLSGVEVERSVDFASANDLKAWVNNSSRYLSAATLGTPTNQLATVSGATFASGTAGSIADSDYVAAMARLPRELGPGQICAPGMLTTTVQLALLAHAHANNRFAILDAPDSTSSATIASSAAALSGADAPYGALFAGWHFVSGVALGSARIVPPSCIVPGIIANTDKVAGPGQPPAGRYGVSATSQGLTTDWPLQSDRDAFEAASVIPFREMLGGVRAYGDRTLANQSSQAGLAKLNEVRVLMAVSAGMGAAAEPFAFVKVDGRQHMQTELVTALAGVARPYYDTDQLYGTTFSEAVSINAGPSVNPTSQIAAGTVRAVVAVRITPDAPHIVIEIVKVPVTDTLGVAA